MANAPEQKSFVEKADAFLIEFYKSCGAESPHQKITVLELKLGKSNFYAYGGQVTDEMKLGSLEYDFLERQGLIELVYA